MSVAVWQDICFTLWDMQFIEGFSLERPLGKNRLLVRPYGRQQIIMQTGKKVGATVFFLRFGKKKKKEKRRKKKFSLEQHPLEALVSTGIGVLSLLALLTAFVLSGKAGGNGGLYLGGMGLLCFFMNLAGLCFAMKGFRKPEIRYVFPVLGIAINSLLMIGCLLLYLVGAILLG